MESAATSTPSGLIDQTEDSLAVSTCTTARTTSAAVKASGPSVTPRAGAAVRPVAPSDERLGIALNHRIGILQQVLCVERPEVALAARVADQPQAERRPREAGGDARGAAKEIVGPSDVVAKRRSFKAIGEGKLIDGDRYLLGYGTKHRPVAIADAAVWWTRWVS